MFLWQCRRRHFLFRILFHFSCILSTSYFASFHFGIILTDWLTPISYRFLSIVNHLQQPDFQDFSISAIATKASSQCALNSKTTDSNIQVSNAYNHVSRETISITRKSWSVLYIIEVIKHQVRSCYLQRRHLTQFNLCRVVGVYNEMIRLIEILRSKAICSFCQTFGGCFVSSSCWAKCLFWFRAVYQCRY